QDEPVPAFPAVLGEHQLCGHQRHEGCCLPDGGGVPCAAAPVSALALSRGVAGQSGAGKGDAGVGVERRLHGEGSEVRRPTAVGVISVILVALAILVVMIVASSPAWPRVLPTLTLTKSPTSPPPAPPGVTVDTGDGVAVDESGTTIDTFTV